MRRIIFNKLLQGHLDDSGLTTKDLKQIGLTLVKYLEAHFHVRVEYPWQRQAEINTPIPTQPALRVAHPVVFKPGQFSAGNIQSTNCTVRSLAHTPANQPYTHTAEQQPTDRFAAERIRF